LLLFFLVLVTNSDPWRDARSGVGEKNQNLEVAATPLHGLWENEL
jgi:hypothetical protein